MPDDHKSQEEIDLEWNEVRDTERREDEKAQRKAGSEPEPPAEPVGGGPAGGGRTPEQP